MSTNEVTEDADSKDINCSFCGRSQDEVKNIIAGPNAYICDRCVELCGGLLVYNEPSEGKRWKRADYLLEQVKCDLEEAPELTNNGNDIQAADRLREVFEELVYSLIVAQDFPEKDTRGLDFSTNVDFAFRINKTFARIIHQVDKAHLLTRYSLRGAAISKAALKGAVNAIEQSVEEVERQIQLLSEKEEAKNTE